MKVTEKEREDAKENLLEMLKPNDKVYTILRHCSKSGMQREISLVVVKGGRICDIDYWVGKLLEYRIGKHFGLVVGGCGMDMGFHLVYGLGSMLWPKGTKKPHGRRNGEPDSAGGYALKHEWL